MIIGAGQAPGKVILFGEHAVVYGRPALAVPITQVPARATVEPGPPGQGVALRAEDLGEELRLRDASPDHPLVAILRATLDYLHLAEPDWLVSVRSDIPIASGMGSGAAVSAAIVRALADAAGTEVAPTAVSTLVYRVEELYHGTPSGIDNTVIAYGQPVYFRRGRMPEPFPIARPFTLVVADTGVRSLTRVTVAGVRRQWEAERPRFESLFDRVAEIVEQARRALQDGETAALGPLMDANHRLLDEMGVSCEALDRLAAAARSAGAGGAKLSGGGRGGNLIALVRRKNAQDVSAALREAGAVRVIVTQVGEGES